nr:hypothetical protein [Tanacetum cinerariifolium]
MRVESQGLQGGIKDNDLKIKIQDHRRANNDSKKFPRTQGSKFKEGIHLNDHPLRGDYLEDSTVTYTSICSNYEEPSNAGSPGVIVYGYDGLLMHPPSFDYVPCPDHPTSLAYVPKFVPEPVYPEFMPPEDDVLLAKKQPLSDTASPTAESPGYITESYHKEDLEEDDEDLEEDPTDYPTDRDDDDDEVEEESFGNDVDDEQEEEDEEEEKYPAPADTTTNTPRLCIAVGPRFKAGESSSAPTDRTTRGFREDYDEIAEEIPATDVAKLGQRMTDFVMTVRQNMDEIYGRLVDAQDDRLLMSGQLNMLRRDRRSHARTTRLMENEA